MKTFQFCRFSFLFFSQHKLACLGLYSILILSANADELDLENGDHLFGEVVSIASGRLDFASESFGLLSLDQQKIKSFSSDQNWIISGTLKACDITSLKATDRCAVSIQSGEAMEVALTELDAPVEYKGDFAVSGSQDRGNKDEANWKLYAGLNVKSDKVRQNIRAKYERKSRDDSASDEEFKVRYGVDWFFKERWFLFNHVEIGASEKKRLDERYELSIGFGFQIWDEKRRALSIESGASYVHELFDEPDKPSSDFESSRVSPSWRLALNFRQKLPFSTKLDYSQALLYSFGAADQVDFEADLSLTVPIAAGIFSKLKWEYDYDSEPQPGQRESDFKSSIGVGYEW